MDRAERLLKIIGQISDEIIDDVYKDSTLENLQHTNKIPANIHKCKFYIFAISFTCILILGMPFINKAFNNNGKIISQNPMEEITFSVDDDELSNKLLYYNGSVYNIATTEDKTLLEAKGVQSKITKELTGEHVSYFDIADNVLYPSEHTTDIELFTYAPAPCDAIYIIKEKDIFYYAFHAYFGNNYKIDIPTIFNIYGIYSSDDIAKISHVNDTLNNSISVRKDIEQLYNICSTLEAFSGTEFVNMEYKDKSADEIDDLESQKINNEIFIYVKSTNGLKFSIYYYPTCGWLYLESTQCYYKPNSSQSDWLEEHIK